MYIVLYRKFDPSLTSEGIYGVCTTMKSFLTLELLEVAVNNAKLNGSFRDMQKIDIRDIYKNKKIYDEYGYQIDNDYSRLRLVPDVSFPLTICEHAYEDNKTNHVNSILHIRESESALYMLSIHSFAHGVWDDFEHPIGPIYLFNNLDDIVDFCVNIVNKTQYLTTDEWHLSEDEFGQSANNDIRLLSKIVHSPINGTIEFTLGNDYYTSCYLQKIS